MANSSIQVMSLIDELEELLTSSSKSPFSQKRSIDAEVAEKIIEDIRLNMPKDIQQANWISREKDRILEDAKNEYNKVVMSAKKQAEYLINNHAITKDAQKRADAMLAEAERHANYVKFKTYEYVDVLLYDLQNDIVSVGDTYIQPLNDFFNNMIGNVNEKLGNNRREMKILAEKVPVVENMDISESQSE